MSSRRNRPISIGVILAAFALVATVAALPTPAAADGTGGVRVGHDADSVTVTVPASDGAPGYSLEIATGSLAITTVRAGRTVLSTAGGDTGGLRFHSGGAWQRATKVTDWSWKDGVLRLEAATTADGVTAEARLTPKPDRYALSWDVTGADRLGLAYDLKSAGHWYGHGETTTPRGGPGTDQPWPLETGDVHDSAFGPASYEMVDPFWYTSSGTGLLVDTGEVMDVAINDGGDGLGRFTIDSGGTYNATVFVESTPRAVYDDHTGVVGKPAKSDATYRQYEQPLWNSWAQFYTNVDQRKLLDYAQKLHDDGIPGHTVQLDDRWESNYGNLTFDPTTFPDPRAMSDRIHDLGFDFGLWVTLWINLDSANYRYAADHGYLLKDKADPSKPCTVTWWNGTAGIIDLAKPDARDWYVGNLKKLMSTYRVDGFKFDTRFFDDACAPDAGYQRADYQRLGAELADQFDLQGAGIRTHWSGSQRNGFVTRQVDKGTGWPSLAASVTQNLAISTIGYPFVATDMIGGSGGQPAPTKQVLVRWAQSAALMPLMYSSASPAGTNDVTTGKPVSYDQETVDLYRAAAQQHGRLAPYIWDQVRNSVATGEPIMRPLFFDFPDDQPAYTVNDEWMLGPAVLAAPKLTPGVTRDVFLPTGVWFDANHGTVVRGPRTLRGYGAPLDVTPVFVNLKAKGAGTAIRALRRHGVPAASVRIGPDAPVTEAGKPFEVTTAVTDWDNGKITNVRAALSVPAGWTATATTPATASSLATDQTLTTTWKVTPAPDAVWGPHDLTATAAYGTGQQVSDTVQAQVKPAPGNVAAPYRTYATTDAQYARSGDQYAIWAAGQDLSGWKDEKGVIYLPGSAGAKATVRVEVVGQNGSGPAAKAGIAVANDLTAPEKGGYAVLVMTSQYGLEFMTDSNGDGKLDTWAGGGTSYHPAYLKLTRDGPTYTAYASADGQTWNQVGTAQVASASGIGDAGMVASAVNLYYPGQSVEAIFNGFSVSP